MPEPVSITDAAEERSDRQGVKVIARAADLLRLLKHNVAGLTQAEMATGLGMARTTVHRLLNALTNEGLVQQMAGSNRYRLGTEILQMGEVARNAYVNDIHPFLVRLSHELEETVDLSILDSNKVTFVDQVVSEQRLRAVSVVGGQFPLHCTANGKALLAALPPTECKRQLSGTLAALTPNTKTNQETLFQEISDLGHRGIGVDREEHHLGICALGVALSGTPFGYAALSVPIPAQRFDEKIEQVKTALLNMRDEIESSH